jgi:hypothetical protein
MSVIDVTATLEINVVPEWINYENQKRKKVVYSYSAMNQQHILLSAYAGNVEV